MFFSAANLRLVDGRCVSVAHRADFESLVSFQVALAKELLHDPVRPLTVQVQRLRRVAQVSTVNQRLQYLQWVSFKRVLLYFRAVLYKHAVFIFTLKFLREDCWSQVLIIVFCRAYLLRLLHCHSIIWICLLRNDCTLSQINKIKIN